MNKLCQVILFSAALLLRCSKEDNGSNPVTTPAEVLTIEGIISNSEEWLEKDKVYQMIGDCSIESQVTWGEGIEIIIDPATVLHIGNNGILTIKEGVTVKIGDNSYIEVGKHSQGSLIADGSAMYPVLFKADTGVQAWGSPQSGGIILGDSANNIRLNYCTITGVTAGINVKTGSPIITNCQISSCKGNGIYFDSESGPADSTTFTNNTISDCGGYPLTLPANKLANLAGKIAFSGSQGDKNGIRVLGGFVGDESAVWRKMDIPYIFSSTTIIGSFEVGITNVTIMSGVVCKFEENACIKIGDPRFGTGVLIAKGTPEDSIFFINDSPGTIWGDSSAGIWIGPESPGNTLFEYCSIQNATTGICALGTRITVSHCRVTGCDSNGVTLAGGGPVDSMAFQDNFCVKNKGYGISVIAGQLANLSGNGSVADNGKGGIYVNGGGVWQSGTWKKYDAPYVVDGTLDIGNTDGVEINIHPGTEFHFLSGAYIRVGNLYPGTFIASGSDNLPIIFSSFVQGGFWGADAEGVTGGIRIEKNADSKTELNRCKIQNGTSGVYIDANVKIQNCIFQKNQYYGLIRDKNAGLALVSDNSYSENGVDSIYLVP